MNGIDKQDLDQLIARTYDEVKTAVNSHSEKSLVMYSQALRTLVELRREITATERADG
ncbi:hypothetical protein [Streptomyces sp. NPDC046887]|uniref:hypothetical protein n=1 Tax=Streptomyces sp. NPDC046887 TaxID=3155472 RepID=UPI00340AF2C3